LAHFAISPLWVAARDAYYGKVADKVMEQIELSAG
jgi:hypothetical protein